ncbi:acyl-CoA/acyl-ACP dehydrogenase [Lysinibacillus sp. CD3-6]|uniref:acyl-CoA dehydrogenase family protein n=1 Tax=Lysinibacillus sp. CD3-6 TaxID=2892541 RepID=UPI00111CC0AD|nr:acyl-CoA dehydrogenase family protein [Lysinibacillus sp. CD3-6]UED80028.1 acyl-CoA/acyl-ACP dehydrogenase [Lysinibacillus sp. CD3-6]
MMYFALTKEQKLFQTSVRKYLAAQEKTRAARLFITGDLTHYEKIWTGLAELGAMAINIPEEYGGAGLTQIDLIPVLEEVGRILLPGVYAETVAFAAPLITKYGTEQQQERYLPKIAAGEAKMSLAIVEPDTLSFAQQAIQLKAKSIGDYFIINGTKTFVIDGDYADALIVAAKTSEEGITLFIVDKEDVQWMTKRLQVVDETKSVTEVHFDHLRLPKTAVLGEVHGGWAIYQEGEQSLKAALAMISIGSMEEVVEMCTEYAKTREQFGHAIGRFQAVKHRIVEMKVELDLAKSIAYYANWAVAEQAADVVTAVASADAFVKNAFMEVAAHNIQMHGGIGFTTEIDCHLFLKRARLLESYLGQLQDSYDVIIKAQGWMLNDQTVQQSEVLQSNNT